MLKKLAFWSLLVFRSIALLCVMPAVALYKLWEGMDAKLEKIHRSMIPVPLCENKDCNQIAVVRCSQCDRPSCGAHLVPETAVCVGCLTKALNKAIAEKNLSDRGAITFTFNANPPDPLQAMEEEFKRNMMN